MKGIRHKGLRDGSCAQQLFHNPGLLRFSLQQASQWAMTETSTIPVIYEPPYKDGSLVRDHSAEIKAWLPSQPQGTRLMYLKNMIWDGMESMVNRLVEDPDCDIAVVAYIFWACQPGFSVANANAFKGNQELREDGLPLEDGPLLQRIATNIDRGFYRRSELALNRFDVLNSVHDYADAVRARRRAGLPAWMALPRSLLGPFIGQEPAIASGNAATERHLDEIVQRLGFGSLIRTQAAYRDAQDGNNFIRHYFTLPLLAASSPRDLGTLDELEHIEALYGKTAAYRDAIKLLNADMPYFAKVKRPSLFDLLRLAARRRRGNRQYYEGG